MLFLKGWSRKRLTREKLAPGKLRPRTIRSGERYEEEYVKIPNSGESLLRLVEAEKDKFWKIPLRCQRTEAG